MWGEIKKIMETKDIAYVQLDNGKKQKVKCFKFHEDRMNRDLIVHEDTDNKSKSSVSDEKTGFRLFGVSQKIDKLKMEHLEEPMNKFIAHFTLPSIAEEFIRIENLK